ncbi:MAG: TldD/PmbA family protein [Candidatus Heimdallarchaeaceae archaeon]
MTTDLFDISKHAIDYGLSLGADQIETYAVYGFSRNVSLEKSAISRFTETATSGIGVRVIKNGSIGMSSTTIFTMEEVENIVKNAYSLAKVSKPDPNFKSLPTDERTIPEIPELYDENVKALSVEDFSTLMLESVEQAKIREDVNIKGSFSLGFGKRLILNSLGLERFAQSTSIGGFLSVKIEEGDDVGNAFYYDTSNTLKAFEHLKIGEEAGERAQKMLGAQKIESASLPILFDPESTYGTISSIIGQGVNAFGVINKTAFFIDKIGDSIASDILSIIDDPFYPGGVDSTPFDDEGIVPKEKLTIVENGILQSYVTDSYTAPLVGLENTGHASRSSFASRPIPSLYALQIKEGDATKDEMLSEMKEGIFLLGSSITPGGANPTISAQINQGFYVKDGEILHPVKNVVIGTTVFELLGKIQLLSKERENKKGHIAPWMLTDKLTISGGK